MKKRDHVSWELLELTLRPASPLWAALQQGRYPDASGVPKLHDILATAIEVVEAMAYMHFHLCYP